jgi:phytoene dehydrogenase-like protein
MQERSVVIVGGGIAGLAVGCYARMNGCRATILEMHKIPGGLCTAWKREGYTFDISMHMLTGSKSGPAHQMWRELGAVQGSSGGLVSHTLLLLGEAGGAAQRVRGRKEAHRGCDQRRARSALAGHRGSGGGGRRANAGNLRSLHGQLARLARRLMHHHREPPQPDPA